MEKRRTGDLKLIQELNRSIILDVIRKKGPISRSEIAKTVGISPTTATSAVNDLIKDKLVYENGVGNSSGGRKPVMLCFNPNVYSIIGVALSNSIIKIAEINLEGKVIRKQIYSNRQLFGEEMVRYFLEAIGQFINEQLSVVKCQGISIITPGIVDTDNGIITYNSKLRLFNVPLKKLVEEKTGLPTLIENDANSYVVAENYFGLFSKYKDMLYITLGDGVGSGIMVDGSIYRGHMGSSGEIGHTTVVLDGVRCECGNKGCLENYVNWPTIYSRD